MKAHLEGKLETEIVEHLTSHGWHAGTSSSYRRELGLDTAELYTFIGATQAEKWDKLISLHGTADKAQQKFARRVADELTKRGTVDVLRNGVTDLSVKFDLLYPAPAHELTPELRVLYDGNRCTVTRQLAHSESNPADTVDLAFFVNGIPISTAELKTQTTGQDITDAIHQYRADRTASDLIFAHRTVVHFAVDTNHVEMTTQLGGNKTVFRPFNTGSGGAGRPGGKGNPSNPAGHATAYLWEQVWHRDTWLDLLAAFVHVEKTDVVDPLSGKKSVKRTTLFPRYHQWHAVRSLLDTVRVEGPGTPKLIEHSAGSGKSNTIAWLAHGLSRLHTPHDLTLLAPAAVKAGLTADVPVFDKTVIVTDRVVLDRQLQDTVTGFAHTPGSIVRIGEGKTSADLRAALESKQARIIITTLQKFSVVAQAATELAGTRFAVIVDEAHSSQSGEAAKDLKAVLGDLTGDAALTAAEKATMDAEAEEVTVEDLLAASVAARGRQSNLTFFAFTATPKHKTLELFGERVADADGTERLLPFHLYSMRQAIQEGYILDVLANYTTYSTYYRLANGLGVGEDPELPKGKAASALARFVSLHPTNLAQKAEIVVEHFRAHTRSKIGGKGKAMVVTRSRLHAVRYHQAITSYLKAKGYDTGPDALKALVAFSGTLIDPDAPSVEYRETMMNGFAERLLPEKFNTDEYQVLVVAEKYQTGFDQPLLHTMYVDKKLPGLKAVQTLARLNRTHPGKSDTFVLDFANTAEEIAIAFAPYFTTTTASPTDPNVLYNQKSRLDAHDVLVPDEMDAGVAAILASGTASQLASAKLNAAIDPAVERYLALEEDDQVDFKDALNGFTRAYSFLGQIVPFSDLELERLYYYGKYLLTKLPTADSGGAVDLSGAVVLTHLRTDLVAESEVLSLLNGSDEPLKGHSGEGLGKQVEMPVAALSSLIEALNERFGLSLGDADRIWFEQQEEHLQADADVRLVALGNDLEQFRVFLTPVIEEKIVDRHQANGELFNAFFANDTFRDLMQGWLTQQLWDRIRGEGKTG
jgi:type I restriction enzyme R subunit